MLSLWLGKALVAPEFAVAMPRGLQEPLTAGWPSTLFLTSSLPLIATILGFIHAWWAGLAIFFVAPLISSIAELTPIASHSLEHYLTILSQYAMNRATDFTKKGDTERADAARDLANDVQKLICLYIGSSIPAPTWSQAQKAPFGDSSFFLSKL